MQLSPVLLGKNEINLHGISWNVLKLGLKNVGIDVDCGACMETFFNGNSTAMHEHVTNGDVLFPGDEK